MLLKASSRTVLALVTLSLVGCSGEASLTTVRDGSAYRVYVGEV